MNDDPMTMLRDANPVATELSDAERAGARLLLARIVNESPAYAAPRIASGRRRLVALGTAGVALAVAVLVAVASIDRGPGVAEQAYAAITDPGLFHVVTRSRGTVPDPAHLDRPAKLEAVVSESWYDVGRSPSNHVIQYRLRDGRRGALLQESASDRHGTRNRFPGFARGSFGTDARAARFDPTAIFKDAYKRGHVRDEGETTLAGRRVRRLVIDEPPQQDLGDLRIRDSRSTYFVDADTLYPVRYTTTAVVSSSTGRQRASATVDYTAFETLPRTPANLALLEFGARP